MSRTTLRRQAGTWPRSPSGSGGSPGRSGRGSARPAAVSRTPEPERSNNATSQESLQPADLVADGQFGDAQAQRGVPEPWMGGGRVKRAQGRERRQRDLRLEPCPQPAAGMSSIQVASGLPQAEVQVAPCRRRAATSWRNGGSGGATVGVVPAHVAGSARMTPKATGIGGSRAASSAASAGRARRGRSTAGSSAA